MMGVNVISDILADKIVTYNQCTPFWIGSKVLSRNYPPASTFTEHFTMDRLPVISGNIKLDDRDLSRVGSNDDVILIRP